MSGPDLSRALTRVMGSLPATDPLRLLFFSAYTRSTDTEDWPVPLQYDFDRIYSQL